MLGRTEDFGWDLSLHLRLLNVTAHPGIILTIFQFVTTSIIWLFFSNSLAEIEASEVDILTRPARSNPVNMPDRNEMPIKGLPVITGEGSASK